MKRPSFNFITAACFIVFFGTMIIGAYTMQFLPRGAVPYIFLPLITLSLAGALVCSIIKIFKVERWQDRVKWIVITLLMLHVANELFIAPWMFKYASSASSANGTEAVEEPPR